MQLDIFEHSRDTMLRNDVLHALERGEVGAATAACERFVGEYPVDQSLLALARLIAALEQRSDAPFADHDGLRDARRALAGETEPAAMSLFGDRAGMAWLVPFWRGLAQRAAPLAFRADRPEDHAAALWLHAGEWALAADAVARIESWRQIPVPLAWMTEARCRSSAPAGGLPAHWALLAELAWLAPARFDALTRRLADPAINKLRKQFDAGFEALEECAGNLTDLAWLPAWALIEQPALAHWLGQAQASLHSEPERAMRLILDLLSLERQGRHHDLVAKRKLLRDLQPSVYGAYIKTR